METFPRSKLPSIKAHGPILQPRYKGHTSHHRDVSSLFHNPKTWERTLSYNPTTDTDFFLYDPVPTICFSKWQTGQFKSTSGNMLAHNTDSGKIWTSGLRSLNDFSVDKVFWDNYYPKTWGPSLQLLKPISNCKTACALWQSFVRDEVKHNSLVFFYQQDLQSASPYYNHHPQLQMN